MSCVSGITTPRPCALTSAASVSSSSLRRATATTRVPSSASALATARPIPMLAPVTTAVRDARSRSMFETFHSDKEAQVHSVDADAAGLDRHRPFGDLILHEFGEIVRRGAIVGNKLQADGFELRSHIRHLHGFDSGMVEFLHDDVRRSLGQEKRVPGIGVDIKTLFDGGGNVGQGG